jgi:hypothetical protein
MMAHPVGGTGGLPRHRARQRGRRAGRHLSRREATGRDAFFFEAARQYARRHPSASGDLNEYGAELARFLAGYEHAAGLAYLPGVARLEWACHESSRAADAEPFDFTGLARVSPDGFAGIRFALHPAVRLVRSRHPIASIWRANQPDRDGTPERTEGAEFVVACREPAAFASQHRTRARWDFLAALARDATLADATSSLGEAGAARACSACRSRDSSPRA